MSRFVLPSEFADSPAAARLASAIAAVTSAGAALLELRGAALRAEEQGSQLKTAFDLAAEGWVLGLLRGQHAGDRFLAEERHAEQGAWSPGDGTYWTVDALDGTRSYVEGYDGFCVQVAFVEAGRPVIGVIAEPVARVCYAAAVGLGAQRLHLDAGVWQPLAERSLASWPQQPRFVDSTRPGGRVGELFRQRNARHVECGSVGLKACRVAAGEADVYAKAFRFRLWDVAPAEVILGETGSSLRLWSGRRLDYGQAPVEHENLVVAPRGLMPSIVESLGGESD